MVLLLDITCNLHINGSYLSYWGGGKFDDYLQLRVTECHDCPNLVLSRPQLSPIGGPAPFGNTAIRIQLSCAPFQIGVHVLLWIEQLFTTPSIKIFDTAFMTNIGHVVKIVVTVSSNNNMLLTLLLDNAEIIHTHIYILIVQMLIA